MGFRKEPLMIHPIGWILILCLSFALAQPAIRTQIVTIEFVASILGSPTTEVERIQLYVGSKVGSFVVSGEPDLPLMKLLATWKNHKVKVTFEDLGLAK